MEHFKLIITIVDRGKGGKAVDLYRSTICTLTLPAWARAQPARKSSTISAWTKPPKSWCGPFPPASRIPRILPEARRVLDLDTPGKGILFTVPLSGVSAQIPPVLIKPEYEKEEPTMEEAKTTPKGHSLPPWCWPLSTGAAPSR